MQKQNIAVTQTVFLTGAAGFIGMHTAMALCARGIRVIGFDNLNAYYSVALKQARLAQLSAQPLFSFIEGDLQNLPLLQQIFTEHAPSAVVHLAAQAGVRYSLENPLAYMQSNLIGFTHVLECCRQFSVQHLVYASSSSVYGSRQTVPFSEQDCVDYPVSFYAATKKANELMAHSFSHIYGLPTTGLRFFTVYGEWGRPDMAPWLFTEAILQNKPIKVFNRGQLQRDFTYIGDIVDGVLRVLAEPPQAGSHPDSVAPYALYNIGNHQPIELMAFIETLEACLGKRAEKIWLPMQTGDVPITYADTDLLQTRFNFQPNTRLEIGLNHFVTWYKNYHQL